MVEKSFTEMILMSFAPSCLQRKKLKCDFVEFSLRCAFLSANSSRCFMSGKNNNDTSVLQREASKNKLVIFI